jgi:hypothetical protein
MISVEKIVRLWHGNVLLRSGTTAARQSGWEACDNQDENAPLLG